MWFERHERAHPHRNLLSQVNEKDRCCLLLRALSASAVAGFARIQQIQPFRLARKKLKSLKFATSATVLERRPHRVRQKRSVPPACPLTSIDPSGEYRSAFTWFE
jgi:hypothetical protein